MHGWSCRRHRTHVWAGLVASGLIASMVVTGGGSALAGSRATQSHLAGDPAWTIEHSPDQTLPGGKIESVSCSSATACTAVGTNVNIAGIKVTLAERWNGQAWQRQLTPNPRQDTVADVAPDLLGVSCPARNFCEAVGSYQLGFVAVSIAQKWNGRRWSSQRVPVPAGSFGAGLNQVSCISAGFCEAVGSYEVGGVTAPFAARWNGTSWRLQQARLPLGDSSLAFSSVSCVSRSFCEAWGGGNPGNPGPAVAERWNGTSWHLQHVPANAAVKSVSCTSARFCEAVGAVQAGGVGAVAEVWRGRSWRAQKITGPVTILTGVSCATPTFCEAVGGGFASPGAMVWNGSAWKPQPVANPAPGSSVGLNGVSCVSARFCDAGGVFDTALTATDPRALAEAWNGHAWALQKVIRPPGATTNTLSSVSCVSASFCMAVGGRGDTTGGGLTLVERWNGTRWRIQHTPNPTSQFAPKGGGLFSVSCVSVSFCEAIGVGANGTFAEKWDGTAWKLQTRPGFAVSPQAVSCSATDFCMAVDGGGRVGLWNGLSWSAGPSVPGFQFVGSVSCPSATNCEVVGEGPSGQNAAVWNGSTWSAQATPGGPSVGLDAVSCAAANSCEAVGTIAGQSFQLVTFAERWDGTAWTIQAIPNPSGSQGSFLTAISCTSATFCAAVGNFQFGFLFNLHTLVEVWNGAAWSLRSSENRRNARDSSLSGVSCAGQVCKAVGQSEDIGQIPATLIEKGH
jgi:hypothetical protein